MRILSLIASFISILLSIHYFYSYRILTSFLKTHHLDYMSIITFEDISYSLGNVNFMVISISGFGLMWIYIWHLVISNEKNFRENTKLNFNTFSKKTYNWIINTLNLKPMYIKKIIAMITLIFFTAIFSILIFWNNKTDYNQKLFLLFLINFLVIPILYIIMWKKRDFIFVLYLGLIFLFGLYMIDGSYAQQNENERKPNKKESKKFVSFDYNKEHFKTSKDTTMIFNGYKYLILRTKSLNIYDVIPKDEIKNLKTKAISK